MEISVAKAQAKLKVNISTLEALLAEDKKNRDIYQAAREKAEKAYNLALKKWEADVKKAVLSNIKLANVRVNWSNYGSQVSVSVDVESSKLTLPERPKQDTFYENVKFKETEFPDRRDSRGYHINAATALYEMKNMLEWLDLVEGTTISRVSETKRLATWL
ncbi:hypothetical protein UFOVP223_45 [uncultured Caudovirales phage]|uniref:Uncharacterized protein n=1 Tax=uncultured Caudovirales phage TaxID=2100421 RepID=A0A6J5L841_9CAUD|nr:hypothetical protein UFOVP110_119 [uncultured Caudovirales phage]CAB5219241.1 hypothetical protein UFOVP223_45 [uncultured Caudovirales phage]